MEEKNNNEKKRQIRLAITGLVALLLLTLGATFAYFMVSTNNSTSASQINAEIEAIDSIALQKVTGDLHINLSAVDMSMSNKDTEYYGDDAKENNYVKTLDEGIHNLGKLTAKGGNGKTKYMCTANAVITMQVATENDMGKFFNTGDAYLYLNAGTLQQRIDLSELKTSGTKTIPFEIGITSEEERILDGYVEIINRDDDQTYLANKTLNIDVTFQDLNCNMGVSKVETYLRSKDTDGKLTTNLVNGLYRYQGNSIVNKMTIDESSYEIKELDVTDTVNNNYICLGSECSTEDSKDLYRIIGVTEDGLMKVIKNTPSKEDAQWWMTDDEAEIKWSDSLIYQELNNNYYNSLSPNLQNKILNYNWRYAMLDEDEMETSEEIIKAEEKMSEWQSQYGDDPSSYPEEIKKSYIQLVESVYLSFYNTETEKSTNMAIGKIGLMNITDYCNSYEANGDGSCIRTQLNIAFSGAETFDGQVKSFSWSWISKGGYTLKSKHDILQSFESLLTLTSEYAHYLNYLIGIIPYTNYIPTIIRPVFYLTSDIELSGEGTIEKPFRVAGIE